jgi:hypothetical protein
LPPPKSVHVGVAVPLDGSGQSSSIVHIGAHAPSDGSSVLSTRHTPFSHMPVWLTQSSYGPSGPGSSPWAQKAPPRQNMPSGHATPPAQFKKQSFSVMLVRASHATRSSKPAGPAGQSQTSVQLL